ncbi:BppU family phage baseplate upper protein [Staphylococcus epidermidis]|nr:BppU family phage baseplate upper protein [Staphylococcus epidermidis]MCG2368387.1 BppU family phage baseplate upper protein [Staphylococcus epidermidis]
METYKTGTVNTIINENGVDLGSINVNLYTMDNKTSVIDIHVKKKNIINENQEYISVNFNQTKFEPVLHVFAQDGSIFTNEPLEIVKAEEGFVRYIIPEYITKHVGQMQCKLFLENPENNDSTHVANFYFTVNDSGITKSVGKEIRVELLDDIVEKVMKENVDIFKGPKGDTGEQGAQGAIGLQGPKGEPFRYEDFTPEQLANLKGEQGVQGIPGEDGKPFTYSDFTQEQLESLKPNWTDTGWQSLPLVNGVVQAGIYNKPFYRLVSINNVNVIFIKGAISGVSMKEMVFAKFPKNIGDMIKDYKQYTKSSINTSQAIIYNITIVQGGDLKITFDPKYEVKSYDMYYIEGTIVL